MSRQILLPMEAAGALVVGMFESQPIYFLPGSQVAGDHAQLACEHKGRLETVFTPAAMILATQQFCQRFVLGLFAHPEMCIYGW